VRGDDDLEVWYFPSKIPELNPVEGCWDQLQEWFKYRLMPDLSTLKDYIPRGLSAITEPNIWPYLSGKKIRIKHYRCSKLSNR
jgi:transposase